VTLAKSLLGVGRLVGLRHETLALLAPGQGVSWEEVRLLHWPGGERVGVTLEVPVWVRPSQRPRLMAALRKLADIGPSPSTRAVWFVH
jgi:hypothetical protein